MIQIWHLNPRGILLMTKCDPDVDRESRTRQSASDVFRSSNLRTPREVIAAIVFISRVWGAKVRGPCILATATRLVEAGQAVDLNCGNTHCHHSPAMLSEIQGAFLESEDPEASTMAGGTNPRPASLGLRPHSVHLWE